MIATVWKRFCQLHFLLKIIWIFCLLGAIMNIFLVAHDLTHSKVLLHLHLGFLVLYVGQVVFILMNERMVFLLSLLQALVALGTNLDFTFVPALRIVGQIIYEICGGFTVDQTEVYKYVFVSLCFTLEMLKTAYLWALFPAQKSNNKEGLSDTKN